MSREAATGILSHLDLSPPKNSRHPWKVFSDFYLSCKKLQDSRNLIFFISLDMTEKIKYTSLPAAPQGYSNGINT